MRQEYACLQIAGGIHWPQRDKTVFVGARRTRMNDEQIAQLLKNVAVGKNCLIIITVCTILIMAYTVFAFWKFHLSDPRPSDVGFQKEFWRAQQKGDYQKVVSLCRQKLEKEPGNTWSLFQLGSAQFNLGQWPDAIDTMTKVLSIAPHMQEQAEPFIEKAKAKLAEKQTPPPPPAN
jgi:tetratricopeptide (TPR) repeat protein